MAKRGRKPGIPTMKETLRIFTDGPPSEVHYKAAARGLKCRREDIPEFPHVRALAIWVDTVLWCSGDQNARSALLDRMLAKESRVIVDGEITSRRAVADSASVSDDEARRYMERLEGDPKNEPTVH